MTKIVLIALKVAASIALLWLVIRNIDLAAVGRSMQSFHAGTFLIACLFLLGASLAQGMRWYGLLQAFAAAVPVRRALALTLVGQAFNTALPSGIGGDAARIFYAARKGGDLPVVAAATFLDRAVGACTILAATLAFILLRPFGMAIPDAWRSAVLGLAGVAALVVLAMAVALRLARAGSLPFQDTPWFARLTQSLSAARLHVGALALAAGWTVVALFLSGSALAFCARATDVGGFSFGLALAFIAPIALAMSLPISIAGWGVREVTLIQLFGLVGLAPEGALTSSVLFGLGLVVDGLVGLVVWLFTRATIVEAPVREY